jgi:type II secretory pathway component PulM
LARAAVNTAATLSNRIQEALRRLTWQARQLLRAVGLPGWTAMGLVLACAIGWWGVLQPMQSDAQQLDADSTRLERQIAERAVGNAPPDVTPEQQLAAFTDRFVDEKGIARSLVRLNASAREHGVQLAQAEFKLTSDATEALARYTILLPIQSDYPALRRFIRAALRELPGLALEEVNLRRNDPKAPVLEAQLRFVLFVNKPQGEVPAGAKPG